MRHAKPFSEVVAERIGYYVYRLVDPRDNKTFYVGKGKGNRVFSHVNGEIPADEDRASAKLEKIRDIRSAGLDVIHIIHRHGLDEAVAYEVEAALIDAYPEINNLVSGHDSDERGMMTVEAIIAKYDARVVEFKHKVLIVNVSRLIGQKNGDAYEAARYAWRVSHQRAKATDYVLAVKHGLVVGVFKAFKWLRATRENFPDQTQEFPERWGFIGEAVPDSVQKIYLNQRIPDYLRKRGNANPIMYADPEEL